MHLGMSLQRGRFNKTTGKITLDTAGEEGQRRHHDRRGLGRARGVDKLDEHLRSEDFLNAAKIPDDHVQVHGLHVRGRQGEVGRAATSR